ncbi:MAG: hypothetical protein AB1656_04775 [Candidatus Omnitrophota bacterium]
MKKTHLFTLISLISLFILSLIVFSPLSRSQDSASAVEQYRRARDRMPLSLCRTNAISAISKQQDAETLKAALEDLLKWSATAQENEEALQFIGAVLAKLPAAGADHQKVMLFKGKALRRLGRSEEGDAIFAQAYAEKWPQFQYENERSLMERRDYAAVARQEFERVSGRMNGSLYQVPPFTDGFEDLGLFKIYLNRLKVNSPETAAMEAVYAPMAQVKEPALMLAMAKALCLSVDGRFDEAMQEINGAEANLNPSGDAPAGKDIPLCMTMILIDSGASRDAAQAEFRKFMEAHGSDWHVIYTGGVRCVRSLEERFEQRERMVDITSLLIDSPIIQDATARSTFSTYDIAHLYDLHQIGLSWSGKLDDAMEICKYVINTFTLNNLPAANCAVCLARYLSSNKQDYDGALDLLNGVAREAPFEAIMPWVCLSQGEILNKKGMRIQALGCAQDAITRSLMYEGGTLKGCLDDALKLQQDVLKN